MHYTTADRIRAELKRLCHTQEELARESGYSLTYINRLLNGREHNDKAMQAVEGQLHHWRVVRRNELRKKG